MTCSDDFFHHKICHPTTILFPSGSAAWRSGGRGELSEGHSQTRGTRLEEFNVGNGMPPPVWPDMQPEPEYLFITRKLIGASHLESALGVIAEPPRFGRRTKQHAKLCTHFGLLRC
jgi:hypothetical protein